MEVAPRGSGLVIAAAPPPESASARTSVADVLAAVSVSPAAGAEQGQPRPPLPRSPRRRDRRRAGSAGAGGATARRGAPADVAGGVRSPPRTPANAAAIEASPSAVGAGPAGAAAPLDAEPGGLGEARRVGLDGAPPRRRWPRRRVGAEQLAGGSWRRVGHGRRLDVGRRSSGPPGGPGSVRPGAVRPGSVGWSVDRFVRRRAARRGAAAPGDAGSHGARRDVQDGSDLGVVVAAEVAQHDRQPGTPRAGGRGLRRRRAVAPPRRRRGSAGRRWCRLARGRRRAGRGTVGGVARRSSSRQALVATRWAQVVKAARPSNGPGGGR